MSYEEAMFWQKIYLAIMAHGFTNDVARHGATQGVLDMRDAKAGEQYNDNDPD